MSPTSRSISARSVGVIGQQRKGNSLYVALDEAARRGDRRARPRHQRHWKSRRRYLIDGRWTFRDMRRRDCGFTVMAKGYGTGQMTWGGLKPGIYHVFVRDAKETVWDDVTEVGDDGRLALTADADAMTPARYRRDLSRTRMDRADVSAYRPHRRVDRRGACRGDRHGAGRARAMDHAGP